MPQGGVAQTQDTEITPQLSCVKAGQIEFFSRPDKQPG